MTLKYQPEILDSLANYGSTDEEVLRNVAAAIDRGETVLVSENAVIQATINEIQRCRDGAIDAAQEYGINLSEAQINILTEMNYRYGKGQSKRLCEHLADGGDLRDFFINSTNIKPFDGIGIDATLENLETIDLEDAIASTQTGALEGDKRRFVMRQIGIEHDVFLICIDSTGAFKDIQTGESIDIVDYLEQKEEQTQSQDEHQDKNEIVQNEIIQNEMIEDEIVLDSDETLADEGVIDLNYDVENKNEVINLSNTNTSNQNIINETTTDINTNIKKEQPEIHESEKEDITVSAGFNQETTLPAVQNKETNKFLSMMKKIGIAFVGLFTGGAAKVGRDRKKEKEAKRR